jgi:hypothetical protein
VSGRTEWPCECFPWPGPAARQARTRLRCERAPHLGNAVRTNAHAAGPRSAWPGRSPELAGRSRRRPNTHTWPPQIRLSACSCRRRVRPPRARWGTARSPTSRSLPTCRS